MIITAGNVEVILRDMLRAQRPSATVITTAVYTVMPYASKDASAKHRFFQNILIAYSFVPSLTPGYRSKVGLIEKSRFFFFAYPLPELNPPKNGKNILFISLFSVGSGA